MTHTASRRGVALAAGAGLLLLTGCTGASVNSASSAPRTAPHAPGRAPAFGAAVPSPASAAGAPAISGAQASAGGLAGLSAARLAPGGQSIIYTATLTVRVGDASAAAGRAVADASAAGGYTAAEQARAAAAGPRPQVSLTLKVPVPAYPGALAALGRLGRQTALSQQSSDVTEQVADVTSRVTSQEDEIAQLRALLSRAGSVPDLLAVQDQLASDESSLESLQAQQRVLDRETAYATITMTLLGPAPATAVHRPSARHGFGAGLAAGWHGLGHATTWLLTVLGAALPFLIVVVVVGGLGFAGRRRLSRVARLVRRRAGPPAAPAA
jgi:hypothetical protein